MALAYLDIRSPTGIERIGVGFDRYVTANRCVARAHQPERCLFRFGRKHPVAVCLTLEVARLYPGFSFVRMSATGSVALVKELRFR